MLTEHETLELHRLIEKAKQMLSTEDSTPEFVYFNGAELRGISITTYSGGEEIFTQTPDGVKKESRAIY